MYAYVNPRWSTRNRTRTRVYITVDRVVHELTHISLCLSLSGCVCTLWRLRRCLSIGAVYICTLFVVMPRVRRPPVSDARARTYSPVAQWPMAISPVPAGAYLARNPHRTHVNLYVTPFPHKPHVRRSANAVCGRSTDRAGPQTERTQHQSTRIGAASVCSLFIQVYVSSIWATHSNTHIHKCLAKTCAICILCRFLHKPRVSAESLCVYFAKNTYTHT